MDGSLYEQMVSAAGYQLVSEVEHADLIVINTCAFNQRKEDISVEFIREVHGRKRSGSRVVVCGCLPKIHSDALAALHPDITFGPREITALVEFLNLQGPTPEFHDHGPVPRSQFSALKKAIYHIKNSVDAVPILRSFPLLKRQMATQFVYDKAVYCLRVASGCLGTCSYCAIRFAKGRPLSTPVEEIRQEVDRAIQSGFRKLVLAGDEITAYGADLPGDVNILDVIDEIQQRKEIDTLYLESFEPSFLIAHFPRINIMLEKGKIPVFCSSAQSGSNRILALMKRQYRAEEYRRCIREIKERFPETCFRNEMMVGFPGETDDDFQASLAMVRDLRLDFVRVYEYEDRPNTAASRMASKVPASVKRKRRHSIQRQHLLNVFFRG
jgi:threonylcarbamoyladenosine tRNA methylthiotransferase MtaB